jgi:hypothetical protein
VREASKAASDTRVEMHAEPRSAEPDRNKKLPAGWTLENVPPAGSQSDATRAASARTRRVCPSV